MCQVQAHMSWTQSSIMQYSGNKYYVHTLYTDAKFWIAIRAKNKFIH